MATAAETVETLKSAMANSPGITEMKVDGLMVKLDQASLDYWERRAARELTPSARPISASIDLSRG